MDCNTEFCYYRSYLLLEIGNDWMAARFVDAAGY